MFACAVIVGVFQGVSVADIGHAELRPHFERFLMAEGIRSGGIKQSLPEPSPLRTMAFMFGIYIQTLRHIDVES